MSDFFTALITISSSYSQPLRFFFTSEVSVAFQDLDYRKAKESQEYTLCPWKKMAAYDQLPLPGKVFLKASIWHDIDEEQRNYRSYIKARII